MDDAALDLAHEALALGGFERTHPHTAQLRRTPPRFLGWGEILRASTPATTTCARSSARSPTSAGRERCSPGTSAPRCRPAAPTPAPSSSPPSRRCATSASPLRRSRERWRSSSGRRSRCRPTPTRRASCGSPGASSRRPRRCRPTCAARSPARHRSRSTPG
jgi:hypothetical protein